VRQTQQQRAARARLYATDGQVAYLRALLDEAFAHGYTHGLCLDRHHLESVEKREASAAIASLIAAKQAKWTQQT
jgi:hypothetical protein